MKPVITADGSITYHHPQTGELYHNSAGAYSEALNLYVKPSGIIEDLKCSPRVDVLDVCFGLGYNTWVLLQEALKQSQPFDIHVTAIDTDPALYLLFPEILSQSYFSFQNLITTMILDPEYFDCNQDNVTLELFKCVEVGPSQCFSLTLLFSDIRQVVSDLPTNFYDVIFHDPFSPARMPELWTFDLFKCYKRPLKYPSGRLATYSSAAAVRGALLDLNFSVYSLSGLGRKVSSTLAAIQPLDEMYCAQVGLSQLTEQERLYINSRAGLPYRDPDFNADSYAVRNDRLISQMQSQRPSGKVFRNHIIVSNSSYPV